MRHRRVGCAHGDILEGTLLQYGHRRGIRSGYHLSVGLKQGVYRGLPGEVGREGQAKHTRLSALEVGGGSRGGLLTVHVEVDAVGPSLFRCRVVVDEGNVGSGLGVGASHHREVALLEHDVVGHLGEVAAEDVVDARLARLKGHIAAPDGQSAHGVGSESEAVGFCRDEQAVAECGVVGSRALDGEQFVPLLAVGGIQHVDHRCGVDASGLEIEFLALSHLKHRRSETGEGLGALGAVVVVGHSCELWEVGHCPSLARHEAKGHLAVLEVGVELGAVHGDGRHRHFKLCPIAHHRERALLESGGRHRVFQRQAHLLVWLHHSRHVGRHRHVGRCVHRAYHEVGGSVVA